MAGMGIVWVLDRHVVLLQTARSRMRIVTVNSCYGSRRCAFPGSGTELVTVEQGTQTSTSPALREFSNDTALDQVARTQEVTENW